MRLLGADLNQKWGGRYFVAATKARVVLFDATQLDTATERQGMITFDAPTSMAGLEFSHCETFLAIRPEVAINIRESNRLALSRDMSWRDPESVPQSRWSWLSARMVRNWQLGTEWKHRHSSRFRNRPTLTRRRACGDSLRE